MTWLTQVQFNYTNNLTRTDPDMLQTCGTKNPATSSSIQTDQENRGQTEEKKKRRRRRRKLSTHIMATPISIYTTSPLLSKSSFPSRTHLSSARTTLTPSAKFNLSEIMGGRGLCNGEEGIQKELKKPPEPTPSPNSNTSPSPTPQTSPSSLANDDEAFEKELLGLTGGFPGGEKGLEKFVQENPPPRKSGKSKEELGIVPKPRAPELPLFMPGMIVLVKNPANPFHMYCGIVQRVTDGKAGVLFEGGNWDKLITFKLDELERREKGPPMVNPKSAVLEALVDESA